MIDGSTSRPDGSVYHITWSLGPGRKPVDSNKVIAHQGYKPVSPVAIEMDPQFFAF
jgi:hypothetical protein